MHSCAHFCNKMAHCGYGTGALWDNRSIGQSTSPTSTIPGPFSNLLTCVCSWHLRRVVAWALAMVMRHCSRPKYTQTHWCCNKARSRFNTVLSYKMPSTHSVTRTWVRNVACTLRFQIELFRQCHLYSWMCTAKICVCLITAFILLFFLARLH